MVELAQTRSLRAQDAAHLEERISQLEMELEREKTARRQADARSAESERLLAAAEEAAAVERNDAAVARHFLDAATRELHLFSLAQLQTRAQKLSRNINLHSSSAHLFLTFDFCMICSFAYAARERSKIIRFFAIALLVFFRGVQSAAASLLAGLQTTASQCFNTWRSACSSPKFIVSRCCPIQVEQRFLLIFCSHNSPNFAHYRHLPATATKKRHEHRKGDGDRRTIIARTRFLIAFLCETYKFF